MALDHSKDIITVDDAKLYLGVTGESQDPFFESAVVEISSVIESLLDQPVVSRQATDLLNGSGMNEQYLYTGRIISLYGADEATRLTSLQYRTAATEPWQNLVDDEDKIFYNPNTWKIELLDTNYFLWGFRNIKVVYNCGLSPVPGDLTKMAKEMVQVLWDESKKGAGLLGRNSTSVNSQGMSTNNSLKDMSTRWQSTIVKYQRFGV